MLEMLAGQALSYIATAAGGAAIGFVAVRFKKIKGAFASIDELTLMVCRLVIYSDKFSLDEKVDAYEVYRGHHGNSRTKNYMDELLGMDADAYLSAHGKESKQ